MENRNRIIYEMITNGSKKSELAMKFNISVGRIDHIYRTQRERENYTEFRKMLPFRGQNALLAFFNFDQTIFDDPKRISSLSYAKLLTIKNIGKKAANEIINVCKMINNTEPCKEEKKN